MQALTKDQIYFLGVFTGYKPAYRKENFVSDQRYFKAEDKISKSYEELSAELLKMGLLKADKNGRLSLKMDWHKTRQLMSAQSDTIESLNAEIAEQHGYITKHRATITKYQDNRPAWPSNEHLELMGAIEQLDYCLKKIEDLQGRMILINKK